MPYDPHERMAHWWSDKVRSMLSCRSGGQPRNFFKDEKTGEIRQYIICAPADTKSTGYPFVKNKMFLGYGTYHHSEPWE